jgi:hypothetical protein
MVVNGSDKMTSINTRWYRALAEGGGSSSNLWMKIPRSTYGWTHTLMVLAQ